MTFYMCPDIILTTLEFSDLFRFPSFSEFILLGNGDNTTGCEKLA